MTPPTIEPELIAQYGCVIGENPLWHPGQERLYWVDIATGRLFWFHPATGQHRQCLQGPVIGGFTLQRDGALLLFLERGEIGLWKHDRFVRTLLKVPGHEDSRFNDVIADERGRVFCGIMSTADRPSCLYRLDTDGTFHKVLSDVGCSNGMAFTVDGQRLLHTDSFARTISTYRYHSDNGEIDQQGSFASFTKEQGSPDGLCMDASGRAYSALWEGHTVVCLNEKGEAEATIPLPVAQVSSVTFGGPKLRDLYITTAGYDPATRSSAGALFRVHDLAQGRQEHSSEIAVFGD